MRGLLNFRIFGMMSMVMSQMVFAQESPKTVQEEESAEVFLEEYTDEFQDTFFEALKQKGIQNYDRAANLLLECKRLDADNTVIDHELAKTYFHDKKYVSAEAHAIEALMAQPDNYWYLNTLVSIKDKQSSSVEDIKNTIPYKNTVLQQNLAEIYFKKRRYAQANQLLKGLAPSAFTKALKQKINDSMALTSETKKTAKAPVVRGGDEQLEHYKKQLAQFLEKEDHKAMAKLAKEALEAYPLQPYFYYAQAMVLKAQGNREGAVGLLEEGLDYLFDDGSLANQFYQVLADTFTELGKQTKATHYRNKIKSGL